MYVWFQHHVSFQFAYADAVCISSQLFAQSIIKMSIQTGKMDTEWKTCFINSLAYPIRNVITAEWRLCMWMDRKKKLFSLNCLLEWYSLPTQNLYSSSRYAARGDCCTLSPRPVSLPQLPHTEQLNISREQSLLQKTLNQKGGWEEEVSAGSKHCLHHMMLLKLQKDNYSPLGSFKLSCITSLLTSGDVSAQWNTYRNACLCSYVQCP